MELNLASQRERHLFFYSRFFKSRDRIDSIDEGSVCNRAWCFVVFFALKNLAFISLLFTWLLIFLITFLFEMCSSSEEIKTVFYFFLTEVLHADCLIIGSVVYDVSILKCIFFNPEIDIVAFKAFAMSHKCQRLSFSVLLAVLLSG